MNFLFSVTLITSFLLLAFASTSPPPPPPLQLRRRRRLPRRSCRLPPLRQDVPMISWRSLPARATSPHLQTTSPTRPLRRAASPSPRSSIPANATASITSSSSLPSSVSPSINRDSSLCLKFATRRVSVESVCSGSTMASLPPLRSTTGSSPTGSSFPLPPDDFSPVPLTSPPHSAVPDNFTSPTPLETALESPEELTAPPPPPPADPSSALKKMGYGGIWFASVVITFLLVVCAK